MVRRAGAIGGRVSWEVVDGANRFKLWLPLPLPLPHGA